MTKTLVPSIQVTTTTTPVVKDGKPADACPGTSAAGALELATAGNWSGTWYGGEVKAGKFEGLGYSVETIAGESYPFSGDTFWNLWINNKAEEEHGVCGAEMQPGDHVLLFPCHYEEGKECPSPLGLEAPAVVNVGEAVEVTVSKYSASGVASAVAGASITGAAAGATTNSSGHAMLVFSQPGQATVTVTAPEAVRTEAHVCVHNGSDGTCGTQTIAGSGSGGTVGSVITAASYKGPYALVPHLTGLTEGHVYKHGHAPRVLAGSMLAHTSVSSVDLTLRRSYRHHCYAFDGVSTRFVRARCGTGKPFKVSDNGLFSYLLPFALPPGRYVLDIQASDAAGNHTTLARGTSRIVFYVR